MTTFNDIGYAGQRLNNHEYRIKISVGSYINNATGNAILGEFFLETGAAGPLTTGKVYIATETSTATSSSLYQVGDLLAVNKVV